MSLVVGNTFYFDENTQDPNAVLNELDKGLRSKKPGEQCEAIVRFPWLVERYPFPILINTASLKLAEVFRDGSNFSRLLVLKVLKECERHLDKILTVDEFVRRIYFVTHSNDPIARSIALRALGSISSVVYDRKNVHHCFRNSLDSTDEIEVNSAIEASACLAVKSAEFAINIYPKVLKMINDSSTPFETKTALLSIFHHSHYSSDVAYEIRGQCVQLLSQKSTKFTNALLRTISFVAKTSLTQIPENIDLLLTYLRSDTRPSVKRNVIVELNDHALSVPHLWASSNVHALVDCLLLCDQNTGDSEHIKAEILLIASHLMKCSCLLADDPASFETFRTNLTNYSLKSLQSNHNLKLLAVTLKFIVSSYAWEGQEQKQKIDNHVINLVVEVLSSLRKTLLTSNTNEHAVYNVICKNIALLIAGSSSTKLCNVLSATLIDENIPEFWIRSVCQTIMTVPYQQCQQLDIRSVAQNAMKNTSAVNEQSLVPILALYFRTLRASNQTLAFEGNLEFLSETTQWTAYLVLRQAMRYGHHDLASAIAVKLCESSSSEAVASWMLCLSYIANAENLLCTGNSSATNLSKAITLYCSASSALKSAVTLSSSLTFQCEYMTLRCKMLEAHYQFQESCKLIRSAPAPAVASATATNTRDDLLKCGTIVVQMRKCAKEFRTLTDSFSFLYQSSFNADNNTLAHIQLLQSSCTIIAEAIESLFLVNRVSTLFVNKDTKLELSRYSTSSGPAVEHLELIEACRKISDTVRMEPKAVSQIETEHIEMLKKLSHVILKVPLCIPRLFFQCVQATCIKLAVSPQPKSAGDLLTITTNSNFTLKTEGVIVSGKKSPIVRKVAKVMLNVTTSVLQSKQLNEFGNMKDMTSSNLQSVAVPVNDYFSQSFVLTFNEVGVYTINVEASVIDDSDAQWKSGNCQLLLKYYINSICFRAHGINFS